MNNCLRKLRQHAWARLSWAGMSSPDISGVNENASDSSTRSAPGMSTLLNPLPHEYFHHSRRQVKDYVV